MHIDDEVWSEDRLNHRLCESMYAGERSMAEGIRSIILQRAGAYYAAGKDELASAYRNLADAINKDVVIPAQEKCIEWKKKGESIKS